jgi:hypothetical protein
MAADDAFREGESLAIDWIEGRSEMSGDLALLVNGMTQPLDETARAFLLTIGNAARAVARREDLSTLAGAPVPRPPDPAKAQPTPEAPLAPFVDLNEMLRRRRERERAARYKELARANAALFEEQQAFFGGGGRPAREC